MPTLAEKNKAVTEALRVKNARERTVNSSDIAVANARNAATIATSALSALEIDENADDMAKKDATLAKQAADDYVIEMISIQTSVRVRYNESITALETARALVVEE